MTSNSAIIVTMKTTRSCTVCESPFQSSHKYAKFCSNECRRTYRSQDTVRSNYSVPSGTVGAIGEMRVSTDLLIKGYEVFRALSPCSSCDLAILKDSTIRRVEVRTAYKFISSGKRYCIRPKEGAADVLAMVFPDEIVYEPPL
jgi:hypothetical protein